MYYESFRTNDDTTIAYQTSIRVFPDSPIIDASLKEDTINTTDPSMSTKTCILLLHGFSGSSAYFKRNLQSLSESHWTIAADLRGHGYSQQTQHGYHVARLAMDLKELVVKVILAKDPQCQIFAVGCSIGAAVFWTYTELFTHNDFAGLIFVDQAPLQDRNVFGSWDENVAHYGCYDEATTLAAQRAWSSDDPQVRDETHRGLVASCLGYRYKPLPSDNITEEETEFDEKFFVGISRKCNGIWLARLLADHTRYDHREAIELISRPILVMVGSRSGCFSIRGQEETATRAEQGSAKNEFVTTTVFSSGHWLFYEEASKFNRELLGFVSQCQERSSLRNENLVIT